MVTLGIKRSSRWIPFQMPADMPWQAMFADEVAITNFFMSLEQKTNVQLSADDVFYIECARTVAEFLERLEEKNRQQTNALAPTG